MPLVLNGWIWEKVTRIVNAFQNFMKWRITERIAMTLMHYCFNNMFSIVNTVKVDSKVTRILGIAKKNTCSCQSFFRPPFWTKIQCPAICLCCCHPCLLLGHLMQSEKMCGNMMDVPDWGENTRSIPRWPSRTGVGTSCFGAFSLFSTSWKELSSKMENNLEWSLKRYDVRYCPNFLACV